MGVSIYFAMESSLDVWLRNVVEGRVGARHPVLA
jgi:hypothetical protein